MTEKKTGSARLLLAFSVLLLLCVGCRKDKLLTTGGQLRFSADTLSFDTVFTTQGSFTMQVKLYNPQNERVSLSSVRLQSGPASFFHLNVDGRSGYEVKDVEIAANDSIYVFATVNVDPTAADNPFVIEDRLVATLNGNDFSIPLLAYGQNAYFVTDSVLSTDTWLTDKPYVIIRSALIAAGQTLTIPAGARIYMHADSRLLVLGTLLAEGTKEDSIIFQGDRLDRAYFGYEGYPGEWGGLYFDSKSTGNRLRHVLIKNAGNSTPIPGVGAFQPAAIQVNPDSVNDAVPQLLLDKVTIQNSIGYGILSFGSHIRATNCLITDCGAQAVAIFQGGRDTFINCTMAIYGSTKLKHNDNPAVAVLNYLKISDNEYLPGDLQAAFINCVIYGSLDNELIADKKDGATYQLLLQNCLVKAKDGMPPFVAASDLILNEDPLFAEPGNFDYHPTAGSPLINAGTPAGIFTDLDDKPRDGQPDIGCYEY